MMKRIVLACMAALLMSGVMMAQDVRRSDKDFDAKARAERMTEWMAKEYGLTDEQKEKLLEANQKWAEKMGEIPPMRRFARERRHHRHFRRHGCCCEDVHRHGYEARREAGERGGRQLTDEQRAELRAEREKRWEEMKKAREDYREQLQDIMTEEQYSSYLDRFQNRRNRF